MIILLQKLSLAFNKFGEATRSRRAYRSILTLPIFPLAAVLLFSCLAIIGGSVWALRTSFTNKAPVVSKVSAAVKSGKPGKTDTAGARARSAKDFDIAAVRAANVALVRQLQNLAPEGRYLVIDTAGNRVYLRRGEQNEAEMVASCGSGNVLEDPKGGRRWVFDTPRGQFKVQSKLTDPIWMKPDWAYIEEGDEIPLNPSDRAEPGMMGDYALGIGQGYFIHGTLYTRLLGRNVSHGCVRLGAQDLALLYRSLPLGTRVVIF